MIQRFLVCLLFAAACVSSQSIHCRCRPREDCWPSTRQWSALNKTIDGHLTAVRPAASVCHGGEFNAEACETVTAQWKDSVWRSSQPGATQWQNFEAWPERHQTCYVDSPQNTTCGQGRISLYSARVKTASHVQSTVRFAKTHNLRLVIKNTGHDFLGRSTAPESLQIMTHDMNDIRLVKDFLPKGAPKGKHEGHAVSIGAGVQLPDMYAAVARQNRTVIGGSAHTVGAAGGYVQGGGHSPFGAWKGLASDHALEFEVVTANVSKPLCVIKSDCQPNISQRALSSQRTRIPIVTSFGPSEAAVEELLESLSAPRSEHSPKYRSWRTTSTSPLLLTIPDSGMPLPISILNSRRSTMQVARAIILHTPMYL